MKKVHCPPATLRSPPPVAQPGQQARHTTDAHPQPAQHDHPTKTINPTTRPDQSPTEQTAPEFRGTPQQFERLVTRSVKRAEVEGCGRFRSGGAGPGRGRTWGPPGYARKGKPRFDGRALASRSVGRRQHVRVQARQGRAVVIQSSADHRAGLGGVHGAPGVYLDRLITRCAMSGGTSDGAPMMAFS